VIKELATKSSSVFSRSDAWNAVGKGSVAAAIRVIVKSILGGENLSPIGERSQRSIETLRGQIASEIGLGQGGHRDVQVF
jgi:hypothetical protein